MTNNQANGPKWLLIEAFDETADPTIVSEGTNPKPFMKLGGMFKTPERRKEIRSVIDGLRRTKEPLDVVLGDRRIIAHPLLLEGRLHAAWLLAGPSTMEVPPHNDAGAWIIDLTTYTALGSQEWAEMADLPPEHRGQERNIGAMFDQVVMKDGGESRALSLIETKTVGAGYQGDWIVERRDGSQWRAHFSLRILDVKRHGEVHRCSVGVSQNLGNVVQDGPQSLMLLEGHYLRMARAEGEHAAIVSSRTLNFIRWVTAASDRLAWKGVDDEPTPGIHPDDLSEAILLMRRAESLGRSEGQIRMMGVDGAYLPCELVIEPVALDGEVRAAFVLLRHQV
ncbi:DUF5593 domain-containing protein (plasmid) [Rhodococcoides fascians A25f]|uniref:GAF domain-containing protein n=1 Tax=Rhodococcoides fascians TaxID=1828 RepID=UPI0005633675|nr:GAF domain-containing protein [Rhodococcus fascians]QII09302.1 DUF5593 domain-containing protein [Rhodococcus fascians A25f]